MRYAALEDLFDKEVEVSINGGGQDFSGVMSKMHDSETEIVVTPNKRHVAERYGNAIVDVNSISSIRLIKPRLKTHIDDMKKAATKQYYKLGAMDDDAMDDDMYMTGTGNPTDYFDSGTVDERIPARKYAKEEE